VLDLEGVQKISQGSCSKGSILAKPRENCDCKLGLVRYGYLLFVLNIYLRDECHKMSLPLVPHDFTNCFALSPKNEHSEQ